MNTLLFSFSTYSKVIHEFLAAHGRDETVVAAIAGPWGSGKTTLLRSVQARFPESEWVHVSFNAWAFSKHDAVWRGLFVEVLSALRTRIVEEGRLKDDRLAACVAEIECAEEALYRSFVRETPGAVEVDYSALAKSGVKLGLRLLPGGEVTSSLLNLFAGKTKKDEDAAVSIDELWGVLKRTAVKAQIARLESVEQFRLSLRRVAGFVRETGMRLVISVDDVDRCLPEQALDVLEAIRLFLDLPGAVYLVAMDLDVVQYALDRRYQGGARILARDYVEKMFDLTFLVPRGADDDVHKLLRTRPNGEMLARHYEFLVPSLPSVPRTWLRFCSAVSLSLAVLGGLGAAVSAENERALLKAELLRFLWPRIARSRLKSEVLVAIETLARSARVESPDFLSEVGKHGASGALRRKASGPDVIPAMVWELLDDLALVQLFARDDAFAALKADELRDAILCLSEVRASR